MKVSKNKKVSVKEAVNFHGHLGPYLVLGLLAGEFALGKLKCNKYFGLDVKVKGATKKPKSCLIDGLQLSTGATFGKGNIYKSNGRFIRIEFINRDNNKRISLEFKKDLLSRLDSAKTHQESEALARKIYKKKPGLIFNVQLS